MIPARRLLALLSLWTVLGAAASVWPRLGPAWAVLGGLIGLAALLDLAVLRSLAAPTAERSVPGSLALGHWRDVSLVLHNPSGRALEIEAFDHHPDAFQSGGMPCHLGVPAGSRVDFVYRVRPHTRGRHSFGPLQVRLRTRAGLWLRDLKLPLPCPVKVYPDFAAVARYALLATDQRLSSLGILRRARRGEGLEFHQLRDYRQGDSLRQIDWKASSRTQRLISREYQDERDQHVVFLVDCGRTMRPLDARAGAPLGHFDHALNALYLLAFVALRQGDAVGVATFAGAAPRALAPRKGLATLEDLFRHLFDLQPGPQAHDYLAAAQALMAGFRRRALVVVLSNLRDEVGDTLRPALELLNKKHLVIFANLKEEAVELTLRAPVHNLEAAVEHAAAHDYLARRKASLARIAATGARVLDVAPAQLPTALVNRYLEMKASGAM
jgi:uncharacterized protein (DUF58 family)